MTSQFRDDLGAALVAGGGAGLVLIAEHFALHRFQPKFEGTARPVAYVIGTGTLLLAFWGWALARKQAQAALMLTVIVVLGGSGDLAAYLWRWWWDRYDLAHWGHPPAEREEATGGPTPIYRAR